MLTLKYWYPLTASNTADAVRHLAKIENREITAETITILIDKLLEIAIDASYAVKHARFMPSVRIDGVWYDFLEPPKAPIGWYADLSLLEEGNVEQLAAMMYLPRGVKYGETDKYGNIQYPFDERAKLFYEKMPLIVFVGAVGEFTKLMEKVGEYVRTYRTATGESVSWEKVFWAVSRFYKLNFFDVMDLNIKLFYNLVNTQNNIIREENERIRKIRKSVSA